MEAKTLEALEKLCSIVGHQIVKATDALEREGGKLPADDACYLKYLTSIIKNSETILAMRGAGSSERRGRDSMGRYTSREGGSYESDGGGSSNRWGRPMYAYDGDGSSREGGSYEGRSMHGDDRQKVERMMHETGDERVRRALEKALREM